ncbi:unnamed protein product [Effrenium voratum]|uniref:Sulfotransferase n=1 Tax=Effrenium voratum TaxID=2562239 RepID=A0AA36J126_9DINO|nr:unnamed protein product [Effrenium voratum]CAJ1412740.1 unnamed protein product [Effrenium voratum]
MRAWHVLIWPLPTYLCSECIGDCASECKARYEADFDHFRRMSFAQLHTHERGVPMHEKFPGFLSAEEVNRLKHSAEKLEQDRQKGAELDAIFADATQKILTCWSSGGRFWYLETDRGSGTLCVPELCSAGDVETAVAQSFLARVATTDHEALATARELSHWADLALDFVVVGMDGCASTALHRFLHSHTQVAFTNLSLFNVDEDFFLQELGRQTLPFASQVQRLQDFHERLSQQRGGRIVGLYQPYIWTAETLLRALAYNPGLKVLLTLCDPVDRFERRMHGQWKPTAETVREAFYAQLPDEASVELVEKWRAWAGYGDRVLLLEKHSLDSPNTIQRLARFLGLRAYPKKKRFHRYNARGSRSSLCKHRDLVQDLKERFSAEYTFLHELFGGDRFQHRQTACDRLEDVGAQCVKERCS